MPNDDDMKIVGEDSEVKSDPVDESISKQLLDNQRHELDLARELGIILAGRLVTASTNLNNVADMENGNYHDSLQRRILLAFAVAVGLESYSVTPLVARTALNTFYNTLKRINFEFYEDLNNSGAFSFYYLAVRRGIEVERRIGQTFAMLCGQDGDNVYGELGEALYCRFLAHTKECIEEINLCK